MTEQSSKYPNYPGKTLVKGRKSQPPFNSVLDRIELEPSSSPSSHDKPLTPSDLHLYKPDHLSPLASKWWDRHANLLGPRKVVYERDLMAFERLASTSARREEMELIADEEPVVVNRFNSPVVSPYAILAREFRQEEKQWLKEFGATPTSRDEPKEKTRQRRKKSKSGKDDAGMTLDERLQSLVN